MASAPLQSEKVAFSDQYIDARYVHILYANCSDAKIQIHYFLDVQLSCRSCNDAALLTDYYYYYCFTLGIKDPEGVGKKLM